MAQSVLNVQFLILIAAPLAISRGNSVEKEVFVESGSVAVLPCLVSSPYSSPAIQWKKVIGNDLKTVWRRDRSGLEFRSVGKVPHAHCPKPNFREGDYSLQIEAVREEDGGMYYCVVEGNIVDIKVMLRVIKVSFSAAEVLEGENLEVTCSITPQPNSKLEWKLSNSNIQASTKSLMLNTVSQKESGTWTCMVWHSVQRNLLGMSSASLQVKGVLAPKDNHAVVYAEVGSSVSLPCNFSDGLILNSSSWTKVSSKNSQPVALPSSFKMSSSLANPLWDRSALIESVEEADQGMYKCSGQMERADKKRSVERVIKLVTTRVLSSSRSGRLVLTCELSNTTDVTHYEWLRLDYGENATETLTPVQKSTSKVLDIRKSEVKDLSGWVCRFYAQQRLLGNVTYHQSIMSTLKVQSEPGSSKKIITVIGLCLLSLLVLLILLQLFKNHRRKKMIMQYPAMETIVHLAANERERRERSKAREKELKGCCSGEQKAETV
ncbi:T-cell surface glycoprotein CD4-like [Hoplias malabaricus]|uniref:T-cell surface glycoprotein CD4-like n=1 Tax=Hoplias malabaricus TaxID=27720 RepID=UPI003461B027